MDWSSILRHELPLDVTARLGSGLCEAIGNPAIWDLPRTTFFWPSERRMVHRKEVVELYAPRLSVTRFYHADDALLHVACYRQYPSKWTLNVYRPPETLVEWLKRVENQVVALTYEKGWTYEPLERICAVVDEDTYICNGSLETRCIGTRTAVESDRVHLCDLYVQQAVFAPWRLVRLNDVDCRWRLDLKVKEMRIERRRHVQRFVTEESHHHEGEEFF